MIRHDEKRGKSVEAKPDERRPALTEPQWAIYKAGWDQAARFRVAVCGRRFGKALAVTTRLPSPDGWVTMGAVEEGSLLFDDRGAVCRVVLATDVMLGHRCSRVSFNDGTSVIADDDHLWAVEHDGKNLLLRTGELASRLTISPLEIYVIKACAALQMSRWDFGRDPYQIGRLGRLHASIEFGSTGPRGSVHQRLRILRGLIESNGGYRCPTHYGMRCLSDTLQQDVLQLLRSLGHLPKVENGRITWSRSESSAGRRVVAVEATLSVPVRCIQVDSPSRLYLCGEGMIPTHNTFLMAEEIRRAARLAIQNNVGTENEIWYGAPTFLQAKRVMWGRLKKAIPSRWLDARPNETSCSMRLKSGHIIRIVGLDASENLRGSGLWFFGGDEWADCKPEAWTEVIRPMLSTSTGHALFIGTPKGFNHFRDAYLLGQPGGDRSYRSFLFTTLDGGNVPPEEIAAARMQLDPRTFRQEYGASFESYAGRVIYAFSRAEAVKACRHYLDRAVHIGIDFNINPMSATVWQEDGATTEQIDEIILPTSNTDEMAAEIIRRYGRVSFDPAAPMVDHIIVYPDPAGAQRRSSAAGRTDIGILREIGFRVIAMASHPTVRDRTNVMNRQFLSADGCRRAFVDPSCRKSIEAYERLVYRDGSNDPDKSNGYDHLVDATGYYLYGRTLRQGSGAASTSQIMER
ncbi:hypothetical protein [Lichenicoccus sp.]|uniref:hypothetical protein n=1 Tax=Lichenicoccus sp. TaxID=2781899 RepID=UPI003D134B2A